MNLRCRLGFHDPEIKPNPAGREFNALTGRPKLRKAITVCARCGKRLST